MSEPTVEDTYIPIPTKIDTALKGYEENGEAVYNMSFYRKERNVGLSDRHEEPDETWDLSDETIRQYIGDDALLVQASHRQAREFLLRPEILAKLDNMDKDIFAKLPSEIKEEYFIGKKSHD